MMKRERFFVQRKAYIFLVKAKKPFCAATVITWSALEDLLSLSWRMKHLVLQLATATKVVSVTRCLQYGDESWHE